MYGLIPVCGAVCGVKQSHRDSAAVRFILCPEPKKVEAILHETGNFEGRVEEGDVVCYNCYMFANRVLKSTACMLSSDSVISQLKAKGKHLEVVLSELQLTSDDSYIELALLKTALYVSKEVLSDKARNVSNIL